jgi:predicted nucleic acid-binding Zn ribbon protein
MIKRFAKGKERKEIVYIRSAPMAKNSALPYTVSMYPSDRNGRISLIRERYDDFPNLGRAMICMAQWSEELEKAGWIEEGDEPKVKAQPVRRCSRCGKALPASTPANRKCCDTCLPVMQAAVKYAADALALKGKGTIQCERCGKTVQRTSFTQKYCLECGKTVKNERAIAAMKAKVKPRYCLDCGKPVEKYARRCPECKRKRLNKKHLEYYHRGRAEAKL